MMKLLFLAILIGQSLTAQASQGSVLTPLKEALENRYGSSIKIESLNIHPRMLSPFLECRDVTAELTRGRQRLSRPGFHVTCKDSGVSRRIVAQAEGVFRGIIVNRDIRRGRLLIGTDMEVEWLPLKDHRNDTLMAKGQAYGREVKIPIREGNVLRDSHLSHKYDIFTGQIIDLVVSRSGIYFSIPVKAEESGVRGDEIKVRNISSGEVFHVTITEQGSLSL